MKNAIKALGIGLCVGVIATIVYEASKDEKVQQDIREMAGKVKETLQRKYEEMKDTGDEDPDEANQRKVEEQWAEVLSSQR